MGAKTELIDFVKELSEEKADEILKLVKNNASDSEISKHPKKIIKLHGLYKNSKITEEDIDKNREDLLKDLEDKW